MYSLGVTGVQAETQVYLIIFEGRTWKPNFQAKLFGDIQMKRASNGKRGRVIRERQHSGRRLGLEFILLLPFPV